MSQSEILFVDVPARCSQTGQEFQMRFEQKGAESWSLVSRLVWVGPPPSSETIQAQSKITSSSYIWLSGSITVDSRYRGCPYCEAINRFSSTFAKCNVCGNMGCSTPVTKDFACPWCGNRGRISGQVAAMRGVANAQRVPKFPPIRIKEVSTDRQSQLPSNNQKPHSLPPPNSRKH
jgi:hypothetical protein